MNKDYIKNRFFVIDSEHLEDVRTRLYGYYLDENGITADSSYNGEGVPESGSGAFVLIDRSEEEITVRQDFCGSYGLYLFEKDQYFALSNSFLCLVDFIKSRYPLSVNKDYADYFLVADLASVAYGQTMVKEISVLDRNAVVHISIPGKTLRQEIIVPELHKVELNSEEGIRILDRWYTRWTNVIRSIAQKTDNLTADLSGGFDSRLTFMLLRSAGVDLNRVNICSLEDERHTHKEDYAIASEIASYYGFKLNNTSSLTTERVPFTVEEAISLVFSVSLTFTKQLNYLTGCFKKPRYRITGAGGGCVRGYWDLPAETFLNNQRKRTGLYPPRMAKRLSDAQDRILKKAMADVAAKYGISDPLSRELPPLLNKEDRVRNHFGKDAVETYFVNDIKITPLIDKDLHRIRLNDEKCQDKDLLVAVILHRYCPELLNFRFDSNRSIARETLLYGAQIAEKYPRPQEEAPVSREGIRLLQDVEGGESEGAAPEDCATVEKIRERYLNYFNSYGIQREFCTYFGEDAGRILKKDVGTRKHNPMYNVYVTLGASKILNDIRTSRNCHGEDVCRYLEDISLLRDPDPFCGDEKERVRYLAEKKAKSGLRYVKKKVSGKIRKLPSLPLKR